MSIYHSVTTATLTAQSEIAEKTAEYLASGGSINQIPRGQSAYSLKLRAVENRGSGTRMAWEDDRMSLRSTEAKACSVRQIEERKAREKARKR